MNYILSFSVLRFLHLNACFPGSTHDAYVLSNFGLPDPVQSLPDGGWLLGDSGYQLKPWLLTPFQSPRNQQEQKFNDTHSKTRVVVERAFGVLKARFRGVLMQLKISHTNKCHMYMNS